LLYSKDMQYVQSDGPEAGIAALAKRLSDELKAGKRVLWLVCGGSNIAAEVEIMKNIPSGLTENLTVTLTDERYGRVGHANSNWQQLLEAGFDIKQGRALPVLEAEDDLEHTVKRYGLLAKDALDRADSTVALFGIGADGHIAGILPDSPAAREETDLAAGYDSPPYTRLTLTFPALGRIDTAYAMAFGASKKEALHQLQTEAVDLAQQPSQILKQLLEAYLYSDQIGGNS
jgi:6-phosphogluconolactonase/glucosamine-6-phosphate isomerase/deaminase